ncbi:zf-HC2 domain-containing protein [Promicromonospora iranensis]|nr:zf-HC2 domain-containing protein [Promicromonospora iranensis]
MTIGLGLDDLCAVLGTEGDASGSDADTSPPEPVRFGSAPRVTSVHAVNGPECRSTRAAMHDYLGRHLAPRRASRLEAHLDSCAECIRAFIDIREASWARRAVADSATLTVTRADTFERLGGTSRPRGHRAG